MSSNVVKDIFLFQIVPKRPHCVVESLLVATRGCVGVVAVVVGTVGDVAGGVTLEVMIVGGGRAWVPDSDVLLVLVTIGWGKHKYWAGAESEAVDEVDGLCSCLKIFKYG